LRHELIDGEHFVTPWRNTALQTVLGRFVIRLIGYVSRHRSGEVLFPPLVAELSACTVLMPDLVYFTADRFARVVNEKLATAATHLAVEILSPGTRQPHPGAGLSIVPVLSGASGSLARRSRWQGTSAPAHAG
jgi:hypothetical protein